MRAAPAVASTICSERSASPPLTPASAPRLEACALGKNVAGRAHEELDCFAAIGKVETK